MCSLLQKLTLVFLILGNMSIPAFAEPLFHDDFKGAERILPDGSKKLYPDHGKWAFTLMPGVRWPDSYGDGTNWLEGNSESQVYTDPFREKINGKAVPLDLRYDPFKIDGEGLHITAAPLSEAQIKAYQVGGHRRFGSGILVSRFSFQYGRATLVAKLPAARGSWPAFWLLPQSFTWPPEIDVFEGMAWGPHSTQIHSGLIFGKGEGGSMGDWYDLGVNPSEDFHEYTLEWSKDSMAAFFDGRELWRMPTPDSMHQRMYLIINLAVGGKWPYNEAGIKPVDGISPERLSQGSDLIQNDYPAALIVKELTVEPLE